MKSLIQAVVVAAVLATPFASFAQSTQPVTRAQVRAELVQLEKAGYNPGNSSDAYYPNNILAAEARVAAQNGTASATANATANTTTSGVGGTAAGSSASGGAAGAGFATHDGMKPVYFGQ